MSGPVDEAPDAYLNVSCYADPVGVSLVENASSRGIAVTWDGIRVGTVRMTGEVGVYRFAPGASARCLGGRVTTAELTALAQRLSRSQVGGQDLRDPCRAKLHTDLLSGWTTSVPLRREKRS